MDALTYKEAYNLTDAEARELYTETMQRLWKSNSGDMWVPVAQALPELGKRVLCDVIDRRHDEERVCIALIDGENIRTCEGVLVEGVRPLAWMPLPKLWCES